LDVGRVTEHRDSIALPSATKHQYTVVVHS
jgi:hypothetical protein